MDWKTGSILRDKPKSAKTSISSNWASQRETGNSLKITSQPLTTTRYHDYTLSAARAFQGLSTKAAPFSFVHLGVEGADQSDQSRNPVWQGKGRTEKALGEMSSESF
jgi:Tfp pilus assembly major pilin PilA